MLCEECSATGLERVAFGYISKIDVAVMAAAVVAMNTSRKFTSGCHHNKGNNESNHVNLCFL